MDGVLAGGATTARRFELKACCRSARCGLHLGLTESIEFAQVSLLQLAIDVVAVGPVAAAQILFNRDSMLCRGRHKTPQLPPCSYARSKFSARLNDPRSFLIFSCSSMMA